jgi:RHS repeat-associated protein
MFQRFVVALLLCSASGLAWGESVNVALTSQGATATASSTYSGGGSYPATGAINGERAGRDWGTGASGWNDDGAGAGVFPAWLQVNFAGSKTIDRIDVFTGQDAYASPIEPTATMSFTLYGLRDFDIQTWNGSAWVTVPGGSITNNTLVWRTVSFPALTTDRIRVSVNATPDGYSRITELEAWSAAGVVPPGTLNNAQFVTQSVPGTMTPGQSYPVSITLQNTGDTIWSAGSQYRLGAQNPHDNTTWGFNRVALPNSVAPGASVTFNFSVTAPSTPGSYNFQWRMVQDGVEWFGALTPNVSVNVQGAPAVEAKLYFIYTDHQNTPRLIADASQNTVWKWEQQEPFGINPPDENPSGLGAFTFNLRFPGQYFDKETNTHYNGERDYDPGIGRYVQSDPIGLAGGINTYVYGGSSPLQWIDEFGLCRIEVRFRPIPAIGARARIFHAYIVTTNPGVSTPTFFRGGPGGPHSAFNPIWGAIQTTTGPYTPGTPDWESGSPPSIVILDNNEPCNCYDQNFAATMTAINNAQIGYVPAWQNSNSVIGTALTQGGFNLPVPPVSAPAFGHNLSRYFSRGVRQ